MRYLGNLEDALPKITNSSHLKMDGWNMKFPSGTRPIFRCYVSFREGKMYSLPLKNRISLCAAMDPKERLLEVESPVLTQARQ